MYEYIGKCRCVRTCGDTDIYDDRGGFGYVRIREKIDK